MRFLLVIPILFSLTAHAQSVDLPIQNLSQQTAVWCWAAVAQQIVAYVNDGVAPEQCQLVADAKGLPSSACCGGDQRCVTTGSMEQVQALILKYGGRVSAQARPTSPQMLFATLNNGHPIILHVRTGPNASHVVVLRGMSWVNGTPVLHINDPMAHFTQPVPYTALLSSWINALVIQPKMGSTPGPKPIDHVCRDDCGRTRGFCERRITTTEDCIGERYAGCMESCINDYGYNAYSCRDNFCHPAVGANIVWAKDCLVEYRVAVRECSEDYETCISGCD